MRLTRELPAGFKPRLYIDRHCGHYKSLGHTLDTCPQISVTWMGVNPWKDFLYGHDFPCGPVEHVSVIEAMVHYAVRLDRGMRGVGSANRKALPRCPTCERPLPVHRCAGTEARHEPY